MNTYKTIDIARIIGIHVNTVRLYEKCGLIPKPERLGNGYRVFTDLHIEQFRLARAALQVEVLQNGLRKQAVDIIKVSALGNYEKAMELTRRYIAQIDIEKANAEEAIRITHSILSGMSESNVGVQRTYRRKEERTENRYRVYTEEDMLRLKIIRSLRCANYSLSAILRMLQALSDDPQTNIRIAINTPKEDDDIIRACDKLLTSLNEAKNNAFYVTCQIEKMKKISE